MEKYLKVLFSIKSDRINFYWIVEWLGFINSLFVLKIFCC